MSAAKNSRGCLSSIGEIVWSPIKLATRRRARKTTKVVPAIETALPPTRNVTQNSDALFESRLEFFVTNNIVRPSPNTDSNQESPVINILIVHKSPHQQRVMRIMTEKCFIDSSTLSTIKCNIWNIEVGESALVLCKEFYKKSGSHFDYIFMGEDMRLSVHPNGYFSTSYSGPTNMQSIRNLSDFHGYFVGLADDLMTTDFRGIADAVVQMPISRETILNILEKANDVIFMRKLYRYFRQSSDEYQSQHSPTESLTSPPSTLLPTFIAPNNEANRISPTMNFESSFF